MLKGVKIPDREFKRKRNKSKRFATGTRVYFRTPNSRRALPGIVRGYFERTEHSVIVGYFKVEWTSDGRTPKPKSICLPSQLIREDELVAAKLAV